MSIKSPLTPLLTLPSPDNPDISLIPEPPLAPKENLLISSVPLPGLESRGHHDLVKLVIETLNPPSDHNMEDTQSRSTDDDLGDQDSIMEPDDDMVLSKYQKDLKLEAIARRDPSLRASSSKKKGRKSVVS